MVLKIRGTEPFFIGVVFLLLANKRHRYYLFVKVLDHFPPSQLVIWVLRADIVPVQTASFANN